MPQTSLGEKEESDLEKGVEREHTVATAMVEDSKAKISRLYNQRPART